MSPDGVSATHHDANVTHVGITNLFDAAGVSFAIEFVQRRLWIEQIHLARATIHEQLNH